MKEMAIFKKRRKQRTKKKNIIKPTLTPTATPTPTIRSKSDQMTGLTNISNLQSENMGLHKKFLKQYPSIATNPLNTESQFPANEDTNVKQKALNHYILQSGYNDDTRPMMSQTGIRDSAYV